MKPIKGAGLGLRGPFLKDISEGRFSADWFEVTPENWMEMPQVYREDFYNIAGKFPLTAHGVGLSLGSPETENHHFLEKIKIFLDEFNINWYSEHLSFSSFMGRQSYELLPVPMTMKMAEFISEKIKRVSDFLKRQVIVENTSWYYMPHAEMDETDFINSILEKSGAPLLLDINNVFVNSKNHGFDPYSFINNLYIEKTAYIHIAGHTFFPEENLIIDTHGESVNNEVFDLLEFVLKKNLVPVMIERDNNIPPLEEIEKEYRILEKILKRSELPEGATA